MGTPKKDGSQRKVRRDARLKDLPAENREAVRSWLEQDGWQSCCARCLSELQIPTGKTALYEAIAFWETQDNLNQAFAFRDAQVELMRKFRPDDAKIAREYGEFMLLQAANQAKDKDIFTAAAMAQDSRRRLDQGDKLGEQRGVRLEQHAEGLKLEKQKFQRQTCELYLKWSGDQRVKEIATGGGTNAEKIEALGQMMFGEEWSE